MLCSSPISARISSKTEISLLSLAGIIKPHIAIMDKRPRVFIDTVLPPVLGPVITSVLKSFPREISTGTTFFESIRGFLAPLREIIPLSLRIAGLPLML